MKKAPPRVLQALKLFCAQHEFKVTAGSGGRHNAGSLHALWRAVDVSVRGKTPEEVDAFIQAAKAAGYRVLDERRRPKGQKVWTAPHLHLEDRRHYPEEPA